MMATGTGSGGGGDTTRTGNSRSDHAMAAVAERGVAFYQTLGRTVATAYLKENQVPGAVIERLLSAGGPRRAPTPAPRRRV
jgi:hypothetical protein